MASVIRRHPLSAFFVLAFLISWSGLSPLVASAAGMIDFSVPPVVTP